jgi:hypothetical protein
MIWNWMPQHPSQLQLKLARAAAAGGRSWSFFAANREYSRQMPFDELLGGRWYLAEP